MSSNTARLDWRRYLPWLGLLCILVSFVIAVIRVHPTNFFGYSEDDSIYFSSAKALAEGKGYVLVSFPGTPAATKYPVFYPWMLSWIWRWNPSFPANLSECDRGNGGIRSSVRRRGVSVLPPAERLERSGSIGSHSLLRAAPTGYFL